MTDSQRETEGVVTTRRTVIAGAGVLGASTLLAACGTDDGDSLADGDGATSTATTGATSGSASEAPTGSTGGNTGGSGGTRLAGTSDIPETGGKVFKAQQVVVTQPAKGTFKGFTAICTHAGCTVAGVEDGTINCGCHGSQFSIEDGSVKKGPASQPLSPVNIKVDGTNITLS